MIRTIRNAWKIPELRRKMMFTIFALLIFRLGAAVPVPFIETAQLGQRLSSQSGTILGLLNAMSGDAFSQATIFALGIQPYINSSIIIQLLTIAIPALERMQKDEGEDGKKKLAAITRYATVAIAILQGYGYFYMINSYGLLQSDAPLWFLGVVVIAGFTAGSAFLMWLGEQITEFGIGNGISIILFAGIVSRGPTLVKYIIDGLASWNTDRIANAALEVGAELQKTEGALAPWIIPLIVIGMLALVIFIVFISNSERKIPVQYAKRVVGRKMYGGQSSHIPMKVNMSGVMPIIFAQAIASLPATVGAFIRGYDTSTFAAVFNPSGWVYALVYFLLIIGFSFFYSTIQFNPVEVANNLKKNGGFVPGFRPGKPTADFIHKVLGKITMFGALFLSVLAILPIITGNIIGVQSLAIGGTSVIIVVGVALETVKAMEAQMLMRHYKGFLE